MQIYVQNNKKRFDLNIIYQFFSITYIFCYFLIFVASNIQLVIKVYLFGR